MKFYVLGTDLDIRGLSDSIIINGITTIDYPIFVDLVEEHDAAFVVIRKGNNNYNFLMGVKKWLTS
jgi:hypothetical protein